MSKNDIVTKSSRCYVCKKLGSLERHHVTYVPEKIHRICRKCHKLITMFNTKVAWEVLHRKLTNEERINIWKQFVAFYRKK